jgi:hypothetical protein
MMYRGVTDAGAIVRRAYFSTGSRTDLTRKELNGEIATFPT